MHIRAQVREAFKVALLTLPIFEGRVYKSRYYQVDRKDIPCALIYSEPEIVEKFIKAQPQPAQQKRYVRTQIFLLAKAADEIEDAVDNLAELVENKVFEDPTLGKLVIETSLEDTSLHISGETSSLVGVAVLSFVSIVQTREGNSSTSIRNP